MGPIKIAGNQNGSGSMTRAEKQYGAWLNAIAAEIERRRMAKIETPNDSKARLYAELDAMRSRMIATAGLDTMFGPLPGCEPTPQAKQAIEQELVAWFCARGYTSVGGARCLGAGALGVGGGGGLTDGGADPSGPNRARIARSICTRGDNGNGSASIRKMVSIITGDYRSSAPPRELRNA
jgi:hypothetical protein